MLVYRFLPVEYALDAIQKSHLRVSLFDQLNDVYDCVLKVRDKKRDAECDTPAYKIMTRFVAAKFGIISFTKNIDDLLVWAHYGRGHTGVAIGYDLQFETAPIAQAELKIIHPMSYSQSGKHDLRPVLTMNDLGVKTFNREKIFSSLLCKGFSWAYEGEYRAIFNLQQVEQVIGESYFASFHPNSVKEIIVGARCSVEPFLIRHSYKASLGGHEDQKILIRKAVVNRFDLTMEFKSGAGAFYL